MTKHGYKCPKHGIVTTDPITFVGDDKVCFAIDDDIRNEQGEILMERCNRPLNKVSLDT